MAKPFEDIGKDGADLISKGFPSAGSFKLSWETKSPNGVTVTGTGTRSFETRDGKSEEKISATLEPKFEWSAHNAEITGKLATVGEFEVGTSVKDVGVKGSKFTLTGIQSDKPAVGPSVKGAVAFKNEIVSTKASVKYPFKPKNHVNYTGELTFRYPDYLFWGFDLRYNSAIRGPPETPESDQPIDQHYLSGKVAYIASEHQVILGMEQAENKDKKTQKANPVLHLLSFGFFQAVNDRLKLAFGFAVEHKNVKGIEFSTAGEYKVDKDTLLKGKFTVTGAKEEADKEFRVGLGIKQVVTDRVTVTVGADLNARSLLSGPQAELGAKPHSFGFEVKLQ